jgi:hypothetical protein
MATHEHNAIPPSRLSPDEPPPSLQQRLDAYDAAERALMKTPALSPSDVFYKREALDFLVASEAVDGEHTDKSLNRGDRVDKGGRDPVPG